MKHSILLVAALFIAAGLAGPAFADSTANYSITGTYGAGTVSSPFSSAGENFSLSFSMPTHPVSLIAGNDVIGDDFYVFPINVTYTFGGTTTTLADSLLGFYAATAFSQPTGFFVDYCVNPTCADNLEYQWNFTGPQQYTGSENNPTMVPTSFTSNGTRFTIFDNSLQNVAYNSTINATVNGSTVNTPEPSSLLLLGAGLAGLALLAKFRA